VVTPSWLAAILTAVVLAVALFSAARLVAARRAGASGTSEVDADGTHVLMGIAMAGMLEPGLTTLPVGVWEAVFLIGAVWFAGRAVQVRRPRLVGFAGWPQRLGPVQCCEYPVPHLIDCVAMVYMFWAVRTAGGSGGTTATSGMGAMGGGAAARLPVLALVLVLAIGGYVVWLGDRIQQLAPVRSLAMTAPAGARVMAGAAGAFGSAAAAAATPVPGAMPDLSTSQVRGTTRAPGTTQAPGATRASGTTPVSGATPVPGTPASPGALHARLLAPRAATWCKIAMGVAMGIMLADML
jgi:Domain of unknown function (DUF5134)